jgi:hypothetical protein
MLTAEQLKSLEPGDAIETGPILKGLTQERLVLTCAERADNPEEATFTVSYFGINLGTWTAKEDKGDVIWKTW